MKIEYLETDQTALELVQPLWERLRDHHAFLSTHFSEHISKNTFEERSRDLINKSKQGQLKIILARDVVEQRLLGYCISSINEMTQGEIDSIFILNEFRGMGIGNSLMKRTLHWFESNGIHNIGLSVLFGNEQALKFYERYGFYPRTYLLKNRA